VLDDAARDLASPAVNVDSGMTSPRRTLSRIEEIGRRQNAEFWQFSR